jgi:hypothetical protein
MSSLVHTEVNEQFGVAVHKLLASPDIIIIIIIIIMVMTWRRMRWARRVERTGDMRNAYRILVGSMKGIYVSEDLGVDGKIILEWILGK